MIKILNFILKYLSIFTIIFFYYYNSYTIFLNAHILYSYIVFSILLVIVIYFYFYWKNIFYFLIFSTLSLIFYFYLFNSFGFFFNKINIFFYTNKAQIFLI